MKISAYIISAALAVTALPSAAATYVYDFGHGLSLDGEAVDHLEFLRGASFDLRVEFNSGFLTSDQSIWFNATVQHDTRISFFRLRTLETGVGFPIDNYPGYGFNVSSTEVLRGNRLDTYLRYNLYDCVSENWPCVFDTRFEDFLNGYGSEPRSSTYRISVSSVPTPAAGGLLLFAGSSIAAVGLRKRRRLA